MDSCSTPTFLQKIATGIAKHSPNNLVVLPTDKFRASVAIILRCSPEPQQNTIKNQLSKLSQSSPISDLSWPELGNPEIPTNQELNNVEFINRFCSQEWVSATELQILYILRSINPNDRHSGQVAFPGGKKEAQDKNPVQIAIRETKEEIGLDLSNPQQFRYLGKLNDSLFQGQYRAVVSPFVFLQLDPASLPVQMSEGEIAAFRWVPFHIFVNRTFHKKKTIWHMPDADKKEIFPSSLYFPTSFQYPQVELPAYFDQSSTAMSLMDFDLWGLSYDFTNKLLVVSGFARLNVPVFTIPNSPFQTALVSYYFGLRSLKESQGKLTPEILKAFLGNGFVYKKLTKFLLKQPSSKL